MAFKLRLKTALPKINEAFRKKQLQSQHASVEACYKDGDTGLCCAIGAALSKKVLKEIADAKNNYQGVAALGRFVDLKEDEIDTFQAIQDTHDAGTAENSAERRKCNRRFATLINRLSKEAGLELPKLAA